MPAKGAGVGESSWRLFKLRPIAGPSSCEGGGGLIRSR